MQRSIGIAAWLALLAAGAAGAAAAQPPAASAAILGDWMTPGGAARVRIGPCETHPPRLCGAVVWLKASNGDDGRLRRDSANPDPELRSRPIVGMAMVADLKIIAAGRWGEGTIYNPATGKTYRASMTARPDGSLKVEGCILVLCQDQAWTRDR